MGSSNFEQCITLHQSTYTTLNEYNETVNKEKRVQDFLRGINCSKLFSAVNVVKATDRFSGNLIETANFLSQIVNDSKCCNSKTNHGNASSTSRSNKADGRIRGRGHVRGGRGRAQSTFIPKNEWDNLPSWKRRKNHEERSGNSDTNSTSNSKSHISKQITAISSNLNVDAPVTIAIAESKPGDISRVTGSSASLFGSNAHSSKKRNSK